MIDGSHVNNFENYNAWVNYLAGNIENDQLPDQIFTSFITLTYSDKLHPSGVTDDQAYKHWSLLLRILNKGVFGRRYTRIVNHSYFGYALASEHTSNRDVLHFHALTTSQVNYDLIHSYWGSSHGFSWIEKIVDQRQVVEYLAKYILKGRSEIEYYKPKKIFIPKYFPSWWH